MFRQKLLNGGSVLIYGQLDQFYVIEGIFKNLNSVLRELNINPQKKPFKSFERLYKLRFKIFKK